MPRRHATTYTRTLCFPMRAQRVELIMRRVKPTSSPPAEQQQQTARSPDAPQGPLAAAGALRRGRVRVDALRRLSEARDKVDKYFTRRTNNPQFLPLTYS